MTNFTTWRSLIDGEEISAIPDGGMLHKYRADETEYDDGDPVDPWPDIEGDADLEDVGGSPTFRVDNDGHQYIEFDGDAAIGSEMDGVTDPPFTLVYVLEWTGGSGKYFGGTGDSSILTSDGGDTRNLTGELSDEWRMWSDGDSDTAGTIEQDKRYVASFVFDGSNSYLRYNGEVVDMSPGEVTGADHILIGGSDAGSNRISANYFEHIAYEDQKTESELEAIESTLADDWNIDLD